MLGDRRPYPILLIVPDFENLEPWARGRGIDAADREALVADPRVREFIESEVLRKLEGFARVELPKKFALLTEEFSIEKGQLTPTLKVRRRVVEEHYRDLIESLYSETEQVPAG